MPTSSTPSQYKRASDIVQGIGDNLEKIADTDVLLCSYAIQERTMRNENRTFVKMSIAIDPSKPDVRKDFHAWSDSLAEKLSEIPNSDLPVLIKFIRVPTTAGFRVWTFE